VSLLLRFLAAPSTPEPPPRPTVVAQRLARQNVAALITSTRAGDEPPPPRATVYVPTRPREGARAIVLTSRAEPPVVADDTRVPVPLVVAPAPRLAAARPIIIWSRTDPEVAPRPLVFTPSSRRAPGSVLTLRSTADVVADVAPPWPPLVVALGGTRPAAASVLILAGRVESVPVLGGQEHQNIAAAASGAAGSQTGLSTTAATFPAASSSTTAGRIRSVVSSPAITSTTGTPGSTSTPGHDTASTGG
jgi:hypothetical protein